MADPTTHVYAVADELELGLDVYLPERASVGLVVWLHGGGLITGSRTYVRSGGAALLRKRLAEAGFVQAAIDYRLAPETKLPAIADDLRSAWAWLRGELAARLGVGASPAALLGHSAGGYLALLGGCLLDPRPDAIVSLYGYGDIAGPWYAEPDPFYREQPLVPDAEAAAVVGTLPLASPPPDADRWRFYLHCRQQGRWIPEVAGPRLAADAAKLARYCPERNVDAAYPQTLLLHGTADTDVPFRRSVDMAAALAAEGVRHELVTVDDGPHGFDAALTEAQLAPGSGSPAGAALLTVVERLRGWLG